MTLQHSFLDPSFTSLKVCGVTTAEDARKLVEHRVPALGVNFWPSSKRYIAPDLASTFLTELEGKIVRVGVFVNAEHEIPLQLLKDGIIDIAQFHGDELPEYTAPFRAAGYPFIKAIGVKNSDSLIHIGDYGATAILLDAHAPGVYGGTGDAFDWNLAKKVISDYPNLPILLAGGITPINAESAAHDVRPAALDVASGSESAPGIKDFEKIKALQSAILRAH